MVPAASTRSWPSIYIPPWAGGEAPFEATKSRMTRAPAGLLPADPVAEGGRAGTGTSINCSAFCGSLRTVRGKRDGQLVHHLRPRSCGPGGSARLAGRLPPGSSSYRLKNTGRGGGVFRTSAVWCTSLSSPAFGSRRAEWCNDVARAAAIDCCSCRHHERSRRCLRR